MENLQKEIENSVNAFKKGKVILYPTDTIWGLGVDATSSKAISKIYKIKKRDPDKSMIILLDDMNKLAEYVEDVPEISYDLIEKTRVPLTIVYPKAKNLPKNLIAKNGSIGIRIVNDPYCAEVIKQFGKPIVSTSANFSGDPSPATYKDISPLLIKKVDYVVDVYRDRISFSKPSTVIKMGNDGMFEILRP